MNVVNCPTDLDYSPLPVSPTSLDTQETSSPTADIGSYRDYTTRYSAEEDRLTRTLYEAVDDELNTSHTEHYDLCRSDAWFIRELETSVVRIVSNHCRLRWCPFCALVKAYKASLAIGEWVRKANHPKLLTLTLKSADLPLTVQIDQIYDAFRKLRKRNAFKFRIVGGFWFFQVTKSEKTGYWHPHVHCVCEGKFIPHETLKSLWERITGDSVVVDIRGIKDAKKVTNDVTRYISRPMSLKNLSTESMMDLFTSFHGRRLCGSFGTARLIAQKISKEFDRKKYVRVGSWSTVLATKKTDSNAQQIFDCWQTGEPLPDDVNVNYIEDFLEDHVRPPPVPSVFDAQSYLW